MSSEVIAEYNRLIGYPYTISVEYTRCSMVDHPIPLAEAFGITSNEIHDPQAIFSFLVPQSSASDAESFQTIECNHCRGLRPEMLFMLSLPIGGIMNAWVCSSLHGLVIQGCQNFKSSDLRRVVEPRHRAHAANKAVVSPILNLKVQDCCELAPEDEEWFAANVKFFTWDGRRRG